MSPELAIVIPAFNEEGHISKVLDDWMGVCQRLGIDFEINVYDAMSTDSTIAIVEAMMATNDPGRIHLRIHPRLPHGPSILKGYREATSPWVLQMDSDDAFGTSSFETLWARRESFDILIARRLGRQSNWSRRIVTATSRLAIRLIFKSTISDANTPYRLMRRSALESLLPLLPDDSIAPNVLISGLAGLARLRLFQTDVQDVGAPVGTANLARWRLWKTAFRSFEQVVRVRMRARTVDALH